jgi:PAS domain S-box-containing protein
MQQHLETKMIRGDGEIIDVDISLSVVPDSGAGCAGSIAVIQDITQRKRMEHALRKSEKRFRQVVENAREWIWEIDAEGTYTYASPIVEKILGYKVEEVVGKKHLYDFFHPDDAEQLKARSVEIFQRKDVFSEFQARSLRRDGSVVWLLRSGVPILDESGRLLGYHGADADITERMRIHEILDRKQKNLEAIFDAAPLGMLLVDEGLRVVRANDTIRQMSGKGYPDLIHQDACQALACAGSRQLESSEEVNLCEGCSLRDMIRASFASGQCRRGAEIRPLLSGEESARPWLSMSVEPVTIDGDKHVLVALNDVTGRKRAEEELKETMEMKAQFISTVSHELRTPLTSMREAVIIVLDGVAGKLNKDQKHFLDIAKRNIDRLARLIDDVLDFQKLNAGRMKFAMQENSVAAAIEEAYATMRPHARKNGVDLTVDLETGLPAVVFDSDRIIQVVTNLISNAIKFTPEGGRVTVSARRRDEGLAMKIRDTGLGIPKEDLPKIFDRFYRVHRPGREITGTGLGLSIAARIVAGHGGRIEVESEPDRGTTFTVILPLRPQGESVVTSEQDDRHLEGILARKSPN